MRILTRYVLREVTSHALIGVAIFTFVLFTRDLARILELIVRNSAPLPSVAQLFFLTLPLAFTFTIPMGVLVGILIGLSRLAADSEITAMRASGIGAWSLLRIISIFAVAAWLLALFNTAYLAPRSQAALAQLQDRLKTSQASFEVQPRVFYEGFPRLVLYVQDVKSTVGASLWKGVFIADTTDPSAPRVTLAQQGILVSEGPEMLHLHLINGSTHETDPKNPNDYQVSTFQQTDIPIPVPQTEAKEEPGLVPLSQIPTLELLRPPPHTGATTARWERIEFHRRLAFPAACLVLALAGIPLGLSAKKGGKSAGFVLTILLVFAYYLISLTGVSLAREGTLSPAAGVWLADFVFLVGGLFLLWRAERRPVELAALHISWGSFKRLKEQGGFLPRDRRDAFERAAKRRRVFRASFPMLLDDYVLRDFFLYLLLILGSFLLLVLVFTVFELMGDILRNHVSPLLVIEYLLNVSPYFIYNVAPLAILLAVLVTFGLMQRANEITAIKATGISLYRVIVPVLVASAFMAAGLFFFDQFYLPHTNKRQDALRNQIKGKPAQTYLNPDRKWIFGQHSTIYYYQFFDSDRDQFANLSVFQFEPGTFHLVQHIHAEQANWDSLVQRWICTKGWERSLRGPAIADYRTFDVATFPAMSESPAYFKKEVKQSSEMSYEELRRYIHDLEQSGFDVVRLRVQLNEKFSYPAIALVMSVLAIPFAVSSGKRGAVTGVAVAVGIALVYRTVSGLFEAMGNVSQLPPVLAAWSPDLIFAFIGGYLILKVPT